MKVFCVGTWKTGTTSMGRALSGLMGGKHISFRPETRGFYHDGNWSKLLQVSKNFTTFDDTPWNCLDTLPKIKEMYPDSKYVLTIRDEEEWFKSMVKWYNNDIQNFRGGKIARVIYDRQLKFFNYNISNMYILNTNKGKWIDWYNKRNQYIIDDFANSDRLLVYKIENNSWDDLCSFLDKPIPSKPFPHLNKRR